jgi:hypothetical protein
MKSIFGGNILKKKKSNMHIEKMLVGAGEKRMKYWISVREMTYKEVEITLMIITSLGRKMMPGY